MSRLYDTVEPSVIDEDMLQTAVEEQGPADEAGRIAKQEGIDFGDVNALRLDFKNILKIDNLWSFTNVVKLQLDNNIIEKIEGLDVLVNLVWLDLSFNNIEVIEGVDKLTKLEDLTLYNNRISRIENMDNLTKLHVFSIGNNNLKDLDNLIYLRHFTGLKTLNLGGNPFCEKENYKAFVVAHLSSLEFLDYRLIDEQSKAAALEKYQIAIEEILDDEKKAFTKKEEMEVKQKEFEIHREAYVELLDTPALFDSMYSEDSEGQKLNGMPDVDSLLVSYKEKLGVICLELFNFGLKESTRREEEVNQFWECVQEAKNENKQAATEHIHDFMVYKKKVFQEVGQISDQKMLETKIADYNKEVSDLWDKLMGLELQLVDQLEEVIKDFERNMQDMVATFIESVQAYLSQIRELENLHHEKMMEIAMVTLEKVIKNDLDPEIAEISEDLRMLFVDKDTAINAVSSSHDVHLLKIDNKEDEIVTRINNWLKQMIATMHQDEEVTRNRVRVAEVNHLIDQMRDEMENLEMLQTGNY